MGIHFSLLVTLSLDPMLLVKIHETVQVINTAQQLCSLQSMLLVFPFSSNSNLFHRLVTVVVMSELRLLWRSSQCA